ncbi:MAG: hypothetical protein R2713_14170 [Ilumatobacteraceae bacterium]
MALDQPPTFFEPYVDRAPGALRALDYPDLGDRAPEPGQLRAGAHTDYGTLTVLRQDDAPGGLEVLDPRTDLGGRTCGSRRLRGEPRRSDAAVDRRPVALDAAPRWW